MRKKGRTEGKGVRGEREAAKMEWKAGRETETSGGAANEPPVLPEWAELSSEDHRGSTSGSGEADSLK